MEEEQHPPIPAPLLEGQRWRHRLATNLRLKTTIWSELSGVRISKRVSCTSTVEGSERLGLGVSPSESRIPKIVVWSLSSKVDGGATASQFGCCGGGDSCGGDLGGGEVGGFGDGDGGGDSCGGDLGGGEGGFGDGDGNGDEAEVGGEAVAPPLTFEERDGDWWVLFFLHCRRRSSYRGTVAECLDGGVDDEFEMDSEANRRILATSRYISALLPTRRLLLQLPIRFISGLEFGAGIPGPCAGGDGGYHKFPPGIGAETGLKKFRGSGPVLLTSGPVPLPSLLGWNFSIHF
ncbi:rapid alkalinization factor 23 [Actinidia rufa]|uniref:Rapid alkalinization factor 23 n=1 Tax=Actinidia rufa TaxID=165716 RepID=A0A7J0F2N8_9ERIC|nr:rapid alkalinization factor 23 [Actinidia rufa]